MSDTDDAPSIELGTLSNGGSVTYTPGQTVRTGFTDVLGRPKTRFAPYTYTLSFPDGENETIEVPANEWEKPERPLREMLTEFGEEYGWQSVFAEAYVAAYGTFDLADYWPPESPAGHPFVGVVECNVIPDWTVHGRSVGMFHVEDRLEPYVMKPGVPAQGHPRPADDAKPVPLPDSELKAEYTFKIPDDDSLRNLLREMESNRDWFIDGYPQDMGVNQKVAIQDHQVAEEFKDALQYPRYWMDEDGKHRYNLV